MLVHTQTPFNATTHKNLKCLKLEFIGALE